MTALLFDTLKFTKSLKKSGFSEEQAEGGASALTDAFQKDQEVVTNSYLDVRLAELKVDLLKWVIGLLLGQAALVAALVKLL